MTEHRSASNSGPLRQCARSCASLTAVLATSGCSLLFPFDGYADAGGAGAPSTTQVTVATPSGTYAIDAFEVTIGDYAAFLAAAPPINSQLPECDWNLSFDPGMVTTDPECPTWYANALANGFTKLPATCVDWCDAVAYCTWANKRLCGRIGGGQADAAKLSDATESQWYAACSNAGQLLYPYGNDYKLGKCNDENVNPQAVGSFGGCEGGFAGIFDMSGNVAEWEDGCTAFAGNQPEDQTCTLRGGAFFDGGQPENLTCSTSSLTSVRNSAGHAIGFRCCSVP